MTNNEVVNACGFIVYNTLYVQLKTASILHVNSQSLVLADYGVKTGYCQVCGASLLRFSVEMFPVSLRSRQKTRVLQ
jgi:hypothetical protein